MLRSWVPHGGGGGGGPLQLQVPLVLLRQVQTVSQDGRDAHVSVIHRQDVRRWPPPSQSLPRHIQEKGRHGHSRAFHTMIEEHVIHETL